PSRCALRISPAGSRFAHARMTAQLRPRSGATGGSSGIIPAEDCFDEAVSRDRLLVFTANLIISPIADSLEILDALLPAISLLASAPLRCAFGLAFSGRRRRGAIQATRRQALGAWFLGRRRVQRSRRNERHARLHCRRSPGQGAHSRSRWRFCTWQF